ncbi:hypothetical protein [Kribbella sp. CA-293567]|uniref:hypothetical protein n=1 Tax=Kribbella sp. CA-293567 TaxID=3002436 RepID=UPI0022DD08FC|nr:hypothetical protein [Kribbella sp. CA-293567]WBQ04404.1 hypothetical protein OX958_31130 [Kribbella sp. CA-293567]
MTCVIDSGTNAATNSVWDSFLRWAARGLADITTIVFSEFSSSTSPRFDQQWWNDNLDLMVTISLPLLVGLFVLQCVSAAIRREPGRLGHALVGAVIGTVGVPFAIAILAASGKAVDEISLAIIGNEATADGLKRMVDIGSLLSVGTLGGFLLVAVFLGLIAIISLYVVMLLRDVAIVAFGVFVPLALASWTWSASRHWLRRYVEVVGALVFSKVAMAVVFAVGISATGNTTPSGEASVGTFLAGVLLLAMAALAPFATFTFIHWAGDHSQAAGHAIQQGLSGATAAKSQVDQARAIGADHFGGSGEGGPGPIVGDEGDLTSAHGWTEESMGNGDSNVAGDEASVSGDASHPPADQADAGSTASETASAVVPPALPASDTGDTPTAIATSTSEVSVNTSDGPGAQADHDTDGGSR